MKIGQALIRSVEPRDKAALARLWQMLADYHVDLDPRLPVPVPGAAERYTSRLIERRDDPYTRALVAELDDVVCGYILGAVLDLQPDLFVHVDAGFIADVFVDPTYRRRGVGRQLVDALNDWLAAQGVRLVELQVASANEAARGFWEAMRARAITVRMQMPLDGEQG